MPADLRLSEEDWDLVECGVVCLKPMKLVQQMLEGELYVTNSLVPGIIFSLIEDLQSVIRTETLLDARTERVKGHIIAGATNCLEALLERFGPQTNGNYLPAVSSTVAELPNN